MKRLLRILMCLWLSILIIGLGAGVCMLHCAHSGEGSIVQIEAIEHGHCDACCRPSSPCMSVKVVRLSPTSVAAQSTYSFVQMPVVALSAFLPEVVAPSICAIRRAVSVASHPRHGPPRSWLARICVLQI